MSSFVYLYSLYVHMFKLYLSVFERLLSVFNVNCMHQGSESNTISILCMYVHVAELTKQTWLDLTQINTMCHNTKHNNTIIGNTLLKAFMYSIMYYKSSFNALIMPVKQI